MLVGMAEDVHPVVKDDLDRVTSLREIITEVRAALATDRWVLRPTTRMVPTAYADAGLSHCCNLAEELIAAHDRGAEIIGRILARALFETWLVAYYVHLGGIDALEAVAGAYREAIETSRAALEEHDSLVRRRRREVRKRNEKIAAVNAGKERWNRDNPDRRPKPPTDLLPDPPGVEIGIGVEPEEWPKHVPNVSPRRLPLTMIVDRVRALTREAGQEETFDAGYHLAYRGLSQFGAHANLFVLNAYLDDRAGHGNFVHVTNHASVPSSFADPNLNMALLLTAGLASRGSRREGIRMWVLERSASSTE